jgi:hypothetical protein
MKIKLLGLALVMMVSGYAEKTTDSKITNVTVFLNKAQVTREVKTRAEAGKTNLVITGLTSQLDPQSIQVSGKGNVVILGISHRQNYLSELNLPRSLKILKDSVGWYQRQIGLEQSQKEILTKDAAGEPKDWWHQSEPDRDRTEGDGRFLPDPADRYCE